MDSFDVYAMVMEMQNLLDGRIKKIYQKDDEIVFQIQKNGRRDLFIKNGKWMFITPQREEWQEYPPTFAMTLRKYLSNGKILCIEQHEFDRIVVIDIMKKNIFHVIIELFSDGNIVLTDEKWDIIIPLLQQSWAHREIRPRRKYKFPPERKNPFNISMDSFSNIFEQSEKDVIRTLVTDVNIGGIWGEEICKLAGIEKGKMAKELNEKEIGRLYDSLQSILNKFRQKDFSPVIIKKEKDMTVLPFPLSVYDGEIEKFPSFSEALHAFFIRNKKEDVEIDDEKERLARQIKQQREAIDHFKEEEIRRKEEGDAIYANYSLCQEMIEKARNGESGEVIKKISWPFVVVSLPYGKKVMEVKLDITKSVTQNADEKYEESKKMREKAKRTEKALEETLKKMDNVPVKKKRQVKKPREKKFWFEKYRWFISSDGNIIVAGKDASSNEEVVKKYLKAGERYVHADIYGAPSCVVKAEDVDGNFVEISEKTLQEACQFALSYSKAWNQYAMGSAYWVNPEQVSKSPESGEYLPKGAFVIRGKRNYVKCNIEIGIGKVNIKGEEKIMGGPPSAIKKWAPKWIIIAPGERNKNELANELAKKFSVAVEKIQRALPPGNVNIKEEHI